MNIHRMGRTGLKVSEICLGTMTFGQQCDEKASFAIMAKAAEHGILVRDVSHAAELAECLRISIGTEEDMEAVLAALGEILSDREGG